MAQFALTVFVATSISLSCFMVHLIIPVCILKEPYIWKLILNKVEGKKNQFLQTTHTKKDKKLPFSQRRFKYVVLIFKSCSLDSDKNFANTGSWYYSSPHAGLYACWTSLSSSLHSCPTCPSLHECLQSLLRCQPLLPVLYHQQICWGYILSLACLDWSDIGFLLVLRHLSCSPWPSKDDEEFTATSVSCFSTLEYIPLGLSTGYLLNFRQN